MHSMVEKRESQDDIEIATEVSNQEEAYNGFYLEKTLQDVVRRRNEAQIKSRELGVMFRNLNVIGAGATSSYQPTLGSIFSPTTMIEAIQNAIHPPLRNILVKFEGVVRPGEMLLVLGSPGSGCTTLLKVLANQRADYHAVLGDVHYDSISPGDIQRYFRGDVQFCSEDDIHFPTLTVEQTIKFAAKTRTPRTRITESREENIQTETNLLMKTFGLQHVKDTVVGDAHIRGVSGGQKKRVSIAEALAMRSCIHAWDNSTRGLDSSTALEFVQSLRTATDIFRTTTIASLYQAGEPLYKTFDKVCLVYEGRMAYFGPADKAKQYFIDMGYEPANCQTTADFLVSVTDPHSRKLRDGITIAPRTADEFAVYFENSELGVLNKEDIQSYEEKYVGKPQRALEYVESARAEHARGTNNKSPYITSIAMQTRAVMLRRAQIMWGNKAFTTVTLVSFTFKAVIIGSIFLRMKEETDAFFSRTGALYLAPLFTIFQTYAEVPTYFAQRPIIDRHEKAALYHPFTEALAMTLVDIPVVTLTIVLFTVIFYFMTGLQQSVGQFFIFFLMLLFVTITMKCLFRAISAAVKQETAGIGISGISLLIMGLYSGLNVSIGIAMDDPTDENEGYIIPKPTMISALKWLIYINPIHFALEASMTNEFRTLNPECKSLVPRGPGYENVTLENQVCTVVGAQPGQTFVDGGRFVSLYYDFDSSNTWRNFGILTAFLLGFLLAYLALTEVNTSTYIERPVVLFKRGSKKIGRPKSGDEENARRALKPVASGSDASTHRGDETNGQLSNVFSWQQINYTVPTPEGDLLLLHDVSGYVPLGKITALMGESGAGKTTLLNVLAQRADVGVVTGDVFINGRDLPTDFRSQTGYCQQLDTHVPKATVREALLFSANLRQPPSVPDSEKEAYVEKCLKLCGLEDYADATIGSLNTEFKKRTTIGVELAAKPSLLLFLDEPTSGLDSKSAWAIMQFLRDLADNGQAILCTIHQPSSELFQVFDRLLLLRRGGETVYFGDIGYHAQTVIDYFERNGGRTCLRDENPAEYLLDVVGAGATATSAQNWHKIWVHSVEAQQLQKELEIFHVEGRKQPMTRVSSNSEFATSWGYQLSNLLKRTWLSYWRDPTYLMAKLSLNIVGGLLVGFSFFNSDSTQRGIQNQLFSTFTLTILTIPLTNPLITPFINIRSIYKARERPSRIYSWTALVASQFLIEAPWNIFGSSLLFCSWYWTIGLSNDRAGYTYLMLGIIYPLYYTSFGQAIASLAPTAAVGGLLFSVFFTFVFAFSGVMQPFAQLGWWKWVYRLSSYTYLIEGLLGQAIGRRTIHCADIEFAPIKPPTGLTCAQYLNPFISTAGGYIANPDSSDICQFCGISSSDTFLENVFNIYYDHHWRNFGFMVLYIIFNLFCVYLFTYLFHIRQGSLLSFLKKKKENTTVKKTESDESSSV